MLRHIMPIGSILVIWAVCTFLPVAQAQIDPCTDFTDLPRELERGFDIVLNIFPICDNDLPKAWYRIKLDMALEKPQRDRCGTTNPIYLRDGIIPSGGALINAVACINYGFVQSCDTIQIKNCGLFNVYNLTLDVSCPAGYCVNANTTGLTTTPIPLTTPAPPTTTPAPTTTTPAPTTTTPAPTTTTPAPTTTTPAPTTTTPAPTTTTPAPTTTTPAPTTTTPAPTTTDQCQDFSYSPWISNIEDCGYCDLTASACTNPVVDVTRRSPVKDTANLECRFRQFWINEEGPCLTGPATIVSAVYRNCQQVTCPLPPGGIPQDAGKMIAGYLISVSNENQEWGSESVYLPYDRSCVTCTTCSNCTDGTQLPKCTWKPDVCVIDGICIANGVGNFGVCLICNTSRSTTQWSPGPLSCALDNDRGCYSEGGGPLGDTCAVCRSAISDTSLQITDGFCYINSDCRVSGFVDPVSTCLSCNPSQSQDVYTVGNNACFIGGQCVIEGAVDPTNPCRSCNPVNDQFSYSLGGKICSVGGQCFGEGQGLASDPCRVCRFDVSSTSLTLADDWCSIGGVCVRDGDSSAGDLCEICDPATNQLAYTRATDSCSVGNVCYPNGVSDPARVCQVCDTGVSTVAFVTDQNFCFFDNKCYAHLSSGPSGGECFYCDVNMDRSQFTAVRTMKALDANFFYECATVCSTIRSVSLNTIIAACNQPALYNQFQQVIFRGVCVIENHDLIESLNCNGVTADVLRRITVFCSYRLIPGNIIAAAQDPVACP